MPLDLPRLVVDLGEGLPRVAESDGRALDDEELERLIAMDRGPGPSGWIVERCVPLTGRRWAVGRRLQERSVWRIVGATEADRLGGHPAWLWTAESWFDPSLPADTTSRTPAVLPLRHLARLMAPVSGRSRRTTKALAAVVAALRAGSPTALRVEPSLLASASHPGRWLALALLSLLPPARRDRLRLSVGEAAPEARDWDVVLAAVAPPGFAVVDAQEPPDEGEDLVAYYVRNRLYDDDPEAVEAAAYLFDGEGDRWGDGIAALIRDGLPGVSEVTDQMVGDDPERAVRALTARLRAGAPLDEALLGQLVSLTLATRDPRPWRALWRRPALQRADAVDAVLVHARKLRPGPELIGELASLYPRGAPLEAWVPALLGWLDQGADPNAVVSAVQTTLLEWPLAATGPTRASVWTEVVRSLVRLGRDEDAMAALVSPVAREIARDGAGRALVASWTSVPRAFRDPQRMDDLIGLLHGVPDGERAAADLLRLVRPDVDEARALVRSWARRAVARPSPDDPVLRAVRESDLAGDWAIAALEAGGTAAAGAALARWAPDPADPLWQALANAVLGRARDARRALLVLASLGPAVEAVEPATRPVAVAALGIAPFPDAEIAAAAEALARSPGSSAVWPWLAVTAAAPDVWDDPTVDATVVEFFTRPPDDPGSLAIAHLAAERLGAAAGWEALDHARWIVRLALAPGDPALSEALVRELLCGVARRDDADAFLVSVLEVLGDLPPGHPAWSRVTAGLPPAGWSPARLFHVVAHLLPERVPPALSALVGEG